MHLDRTEIEELSAFFHGWGVELIQLGPRSGETLVTSILFRTHRVLRLHAGSDLVVRGTVPKRCACVLLSTLEQPAMRFLGRTLRANEPLLAGAETRFDFFIPSGAVGSILLAETHDAIARRKLQLLAVENGGAESVGRIIQHMQRGDPVGSDPDLKIGNELRQAAACMHIDRIARTQGIAAVMAACRIIEKRFPASISLSTLARLCGVSERTLEYGFRHVYDTTPMAFIRSLRLTRSRTALLRAEASASISATARAYGFTHMGQYSRDYRRLFGETPSLTLERGQR